jgi:hypothetical protein
MDFKKTYNSVRREVLYNMLIEFGVPMKLVRLIKMYSIETYGKVHIGKHLSESFPIQNGLKQGDALSSLPFNFCSECTIRKVQKKRMGQKLNEIHQPRVYADDVNLLGDSIDAIKKNTDILTDANKEISLEMIVGQTKYLLLSRPQNSGQNWDIKIANRNCVTVIIFGNDFCIGMKFGF